jgi:nicotinamidase-related amidase
MSHKRILDGTKSVFVIVDVQEAFRSVIGDFALIASNIARASLGFQILDVPMIVTEQYPAGLGRTAEEILLTLPDGFEPIEKIAFSAFGSPDFRVKLEDLKVEQVILCGLETHVCVNQTAHDLLDQGLSVHLLTDCVGSRFEHDKRSGLKKMRGSGIITSSVEMALFELMRDAKHPKFKETQALIK